MSTSFSISAAEFVPMSMRGGGVGVGGGGSTVRSPSNPSQTSATTAPPQSQDPISVFNSQMNSAAAAAAAGVGGGALTSTSHPSSQQQQHSSGLHGVGGGGGLGAMGMGGIGMGMGRGHHSAPFGNVCGTKSTVCTPFFRQGACSDTSCRFAHSLAELEFSAQQQLITMAGGEEFLPIHFTHGLFAHGLSHYMQRAGGLFSASAPPTPSNMIGSHSRHHTTNGGMGRGGLGMGSGAGTNISTTTTSSNSTITSAVGASGSPSFGYGGSGNASTTVGSSSGGCGGGGGATAGAWEDVRVTLPARCHFPHAIGGTYYDYLNVKRHCDPKDIEASYRSWRSSGYKAAKSIDQSKADAMDRLVVEARLVLGNPIMRAEYDALLPLEEGTVLPPPSVLGDEDSIW